MKKKNEKIKKINKNYTVENNLIIIFCYYTVKAEITAWISIYNEKLKSMIEDMTVFS